jgi:hypothetical protein
MLYGASTYGTVPPGGLLATFGTFFSPSQGLDVGVYRITQEYLGDAEFYQVILQMENVPTEPQVIVRVYTHNDLSETPQLQVLLGEAFYSQAIVGAARFIVVELEMLVDKHPIGLTITGSEYFQ